MKKTRAIAAAAAVGMTTAVFVSTVSAIDVYLDGNRTEFTDATPYIRNERTMVPIRPIMEEMGWEVEWHETESKAVFLDNMGKRIVVTAGEKQIWYERDSNGEDYYRGGLVFSDVPAEIKDGRIMLPLRIVAELTGKGVTWNDSTQRVDLTDGKSDKESVDSDLINFMMKFEVINGETAVVDYDNDEQYEVVTWQTGNLYDEYGNLEGYDREDISRIYIYEKENNGVIHRTKTITSDDNDFQSIHDKIW